MAETTAGLNEIIRRFCQQLTEMGIQVEQVWVYGSQARGTATEGSDIDLIIVSSSWAGMGLRERLEILGVAAARILEPIQAQGITPEELEQGAISLFLAEILRTQAVAVG